MKPTIRCEYCIKPIWDHNYIMVRDQVMETNIYFHSRCRERERAERLNYERDVGMLRKIIDSL